MDMQAALLARLKADATLSALTGGRIYWIQRPQASALPAIALRTQGEEWPQHLDGFDDMRSALVFADCFAATYVETRRMAAAVVNAVVEPGEVADATGADVLFWRAELDGITDLGDQSGTIFIYHAAVGLIVRWGLAA